MRIWNDPEEKALKYTLLGLRFEPETERKFQNDTGDRRRDRILVSALLGLVVFNAFLLNDYANRPEIIEFAIVVRLGFVTLSCLPLLYFLKVARSVWLREMIIGTAIVIVTIGAIVVNLATTSDDAIFDAFSFSLVIVATNTLMPLRFSTHAIVTFFVLIVIALGTFWHETIPFIAQKNSIIIHVATAGFTLIVSFRLEREQRIVYLNMMKAEGRQREVDRINGELASLSRTDALTGVANRRDFDEQLEIAHSDAINAYVPLALLSLDVDNFKLYNDSWGHLKGDECLQQVATAISSVVEHRSAKFARIGGEEFGVILQGRDALDAIEIADEIRIAVAQLHIPHPANTGHDFVTASIGVASFRNSAGDNIQSLLSRVDEALYRAKDNGRNRTELGDAAELLDGLSAIA